MNICRLFRNKLDRVVFKKEIFIMIAILIPILILTSLLFSARTTMKTKIALVSEDNPSIPMNNKFIVEVMKEIPSNSQLCLGRYDVVLQENSDGGFKVITGMKNKADLRIIEDFFNHGASLDSYDSLESKRGMGSKILGCIVMCVLMLGVGLTVFYPEDRTIAAFRRILMAPVGQNTYFLAQGAFTFICSYIPCLLAMIFAKECIGIKMGFGIGMLAILIGILSAFATAFGLFISSVLNRNISVTASLIAILTSLLAGCFQFFEVNNKILDAIFSIIPQKSYMTLIEGVEKGRGMLEFKGQLVYLLVWIIVLWFTGIFISKRKVTKGVY